MNPPHDASDESIFKTIARYSSSNIYRHITRAANAYIRPKLLEPELYGFWNLIGLLLFYSCYGHLGSRDTMRYLVPYYEGSKQFDKSLRLKGSVFYGTLYLSILFSLGILVYAFAAHHDTPVKLGLVTLSVLMIINWYDEFYAVHILSSQKFRLLTSKNYIESTVSLVLSASLLYFLSIYGLYISITVTGIIILVYLRANHSLEKHYRFDAGLFLDSVKKGFPIIIFGFSVVLVRTSDSILISSFLGNRMLGFYGIAVALFDFLMQIPGASRDVLEPKLMESLSRNSVEESFRAYFLKPLFSTAYLIPLLIGPAFFTIPLFIKLLLPKYIPGIMPAQIIIFGVYFFALSFISRGIIVANNWQLKTLYITFSVLVLNIAVSITLIKTGFGIEGVAVSSNIAYFMLYIGLTVFILRKYKYGAKKCVGTLLQLFWPFPIMCGTIAALNRLSGMFIPNMYAAAGVDLVIYGIVMFLVIGFARKRHPMLKGLSLHEAV